MRTATEQITPRIAAAYLSRPASNRPIKSYVVASYAADMREGLWRLTHQGIALTTDGLLCDGQHRLRALIEADVTLPFAVTRDVPPEAVEGLDCGATRTLRDAEAVMGLQRSCQFAPALRGIYTLEQRRADVRVRLQSKSFLRWASPQYEEAIDFVLTDVCQPRTIFTGAVIGVLARAYYSQDLERLRALIAVLRTGLGGSDDMAAVLFRNWTLTCPQTGALACREAVYRKFETAAAAFFGYRRIRALDQSRKEKFPLPDGLRLFDTA